MVVKAKDVVRDAPVVVAAAPVNSRESRSSTLPPELVPVRPAPARPDTSPEFKISLHFKKMNNTPRSVVGRAHMGDHYETTE
jgi:hypothetical protein